MNMPEDNLENTGELENDDIMEPEPSPDQINLWSELENSTNQEILEREDLFAGLPQDIKTMLTSETTSIKIISIGQKYGLTKNQILILARFIKDIFLDPDEDVEIPILINSLSSNLNIELEKAKTIFLEINNEILIPSLRNVPDIPDIETPLERPVPAVSSTNINNNIIDLKNPPK